MSEHQSGLEKLRRRLFDDYCVVRDTIAEVESLRRGIAEYRSIDHNGVPLGPETIKGQLKQLDECLKFENEIAEILKVEGDPSADVANPAYVKNGGFHGWALAKIRALASSCSAETPQSPRVGDIVELTSFAWRGRKAKVIAVGTSVIDVGTPVIDVDVTMNGPARSLGTFRFDEVKVIERAAK